MKRYVAQCGRQASRIQWYAIGAAATLSVASACGGKTSTNDNSLLDDSSLVGAGEILDVANPASTPPGVISTNVPPGVGTSVRPTPTSVAPAPRPTPTGIPPRPIPVPTGPEPSTTGPVSTDMDSTSDATSETTDIDPTMTGSTDPTTDPTSSAPDPTTTEVTSEPPPVFDPLNPPDGQVPLGLPEAYADFKWFDTDTCGAHYEWSGTSECYSAHSCDQGETSINCSQVDDGNWACSCYGFDGQYYGTSVPGAIVSPEDTRQACRVGSAICLSAAPPTQEPTCDDRESSAPEYCWRERVCDERWSSTYGDFVVDGKVSAVSCYSGENAGIVGCSCSGITGYESFDLSSDLSAACGVGMDVCQVGVAADTLQAVECEWASSDFASTWCQENFTCKQQGTSGGVAVSANGQVNVSCWQNEDATWACSCGDGVSATPGTGESGALSVCDAASQECIERQSNLFN